MSKDFLPEVGHQTVTGGYRALYRMFDNQSWRPVCDKVTKKPCIYKDVIEATKAAKEILRIKLNPHLHCSNDMKPDPAEDQDMLGIEEWRKKQVEEYAKTKALKNGKSHRTVVVERKKKRRI